MVVIIVVILPIVLHGLLRREILAAFLTWASHAPRIPRIILHVAQFVIRIGPPIGLAFLRRAFVSPDESLLSKPLFPRVASLLTVTATFAPEMLCSAPLSLMSQESLDKEPFSGH